MVGATRVLSGAEAGPHLVVDEVVQAQRALRLPARDYRLRLAQLLVKMAEKSKVARAGGT